jgi:DNA helicase-2/ATP-dependent DNA helicase PcrA
MALEPPERGIAESGRKDKDDSTLTLTTIHSAKGLEWNTVFMIYVAEGHMPSYLSLENEDAIEEERRLFYVASTRAKENLFLLKPHIDRSPRSFMDGGGSVFTQVSRFLDESNIMDNLIQVEPQAIEEDSEYDDLDEPQKNLVKDKEFLEMMKDYFRSRQDY